MNTKRILILDACFLGIAGSVQIILELLGYFGGVGLYGEVFGTSPYTIGFFEAHGLALLIAIAMFNQVQSPQQRFWHGFAVSIHVLLGGANLMFWPSFVEFNIVAGGVIATLLHITFILLNAKAWRKVSS